jgi:hypothetical protein
MKMVVCVSLLLLSATSAILASEPASMNSSGTDVFLSAIKVSVDRALVNEQVVNAGYAYEDQLAEAFKQGNCLLWLSVQVENQKVASELFISPSDFRLICFDNVSHPYESSRREISSHINAGEIAKGGLLFVIPTNSSPKVLRYNPSTVLRSFEFGDVTPEVTIAVPLRWTGATFVVDSDFWKSRFMEANPELKQFSRPSPVAAQSPSSEQQWNKKQEADKRLLIWQQQQASNGVAYSQFDLGKRYLTGNGVETNRTLGMYWIQKSAAQDFRDAQEFLRQQR